MAEKNEKRSKSLLFRLAAIAFGIYLVVALVGQQIEIREKKAALNTIEQKCHAQEAENVELQRLLGQGNDRSYVEEVARDKLGYAYPDEKVFVDASGS